MTNANQRRMVGVSKEDIRVQGAINWLRRHYTLDANPGLDNLGCRLYEYYYAFATTMSVLGDDVFVDVNNVRHSWRDELVCVLRAQQQPDGSWINPAESSKYREANHLVTTSYAVMSLCQVVRR